MRSPILFEVMAHIVLGMQMVYLQSPSAFHILTVQSSPPETISPVARVVTANTKPWWPVNVYSKIPSFDHNFTVSSFEHDAKPKPGTSVNCLIMSL